MIIIEVMYIGTKSVRLQYSLKLSRLIWSSLTFHYTMTRNFTPVAKTEDLSKQVKQQVEPADISDSKVENSVFLVEPYSKDFTNDRILL